MSASRPLSLLLQEDSRLSALRLGLDAIPVRMKGSKFNLRLRKSQEPAQHAPEVCSLEAAVVADLCKHCQAATARDLDSSLR